MQAGESAEGHGSSGKGGGVHVDSEQLVDSGQPGGRARHAVMGWLEAVFFLVPRGRTREHKTDSYTRQGQPAEGAGEDGRGRGCCEEEEGGGTDGGPTEVADAVGKPGEEVKNRMGMGGENVGDVGAVQNVLEGREDFDPDVWAVLHGNETVGGGQLEGSQSLPVSGIGTHRLQKK